MSAPIETNVMNDSLDRQHHRALRFLTAGSVDDGKSTLIGRLLFDARAILSDQLDALQDRAAGAPIDLSLLTDGLEAEREQKITIDVAYRYFATRRRKFIIADAPGHEQYTRNMVTAAAGSDAAVVLVDITKIDWRVGSVALLPQTRRHSLLARLLRLPNIVFAINKLDVLDDEARLAYDAMREALLEFARHADIKVGGIIPISALRGDNVATSSHHWTWYEGPTLLQLLERLPVASEPDDGHFLQPVQYVARDGDGTGSQSRIAWGRIAQGDVRAGDAVQVFPSGESAIVAQVRRAGQVVEQCEAGQSAGIVLDRQVDVSRGDWIASAGELSVTDQFDATLAWLDPEPAVIGRKYWLRHGNRWMQGCIVGIRHRIDIDTLEPIQAQQLLANEVGQVSIRTQGRLPVNPYEKNRVSGALIIVDPTTNRTSGALMASATA